MKNNVAFKLAASTLVIGLTMVGCKPAGSRPSALSAKAATADRSSAKLYAKAQEAAQAGNLAEALAHAEQAVELSPRDAGYRMLLADLYLKNGRFLSAETAFSDVLVLDPGNSRAGLSRVLAMIGQGKSGEATIELDRVSNFAAPADVGLAYALAGQPARAVEMLEPAARAPEATARVRQNLALSYALAGEWEKARTVAAQDLSPAEVSGRLQQWATFANPTAPYSQVATLLGVTPSEDAGQPVRLALAPAEPQMQAFAAAEPEAPVVEAAPQPKDYAAGGPEGPLIETVIEAEPAEAVFAAAPAPEPAADTVETFAAAAQPAPAEIAIRAVADAQPEQRVAGVQFAAAVQSLVEAPAVPDAPKIEVAPVRAFEKEKAAKSKVRAIGRYVVQIGAFRSSAQVEKAWARAQRRYSFGDSQPLSTTITIPGQGTFHRLAVSGFQTPQAAQRLCQSIRSRQGACFVRATAGDAPVRWASRYTGRGA